MANNTSSPDFFGYVKPVVGQYLISSDYASLYMANSAGSNNISAQKLGLVQSAAASYQQNLQPRFQAGDSSMYWLAGQSLGTLQIGRLVGDQGILAGVNQGQNPNTLTKGILGGVEFKIGRMGLQNVSISQSILMLTGCVLQGVGYSFNVGSLEVQEALTIHAGMMQATTSS